MKWVVSRDAQQMCKFRILDTFQGEELPIGTTVLDDTINESTVLIVAENICEAIRDDCCMDIEFTICFRKYGMMGLNMIFEEFNWMAEDWEFFRYEMALALVAVIRRYRLQRYKNATTNQQVWNELEQIENAILVASGDEESHKQSYNLVTTGGMQVAEG